MTTGLISAGARRTVAKPAPGRRPLAQRAQAQHDGHAPDTLTRVTGASDNVPGESAFQSAL